MKSFKHPIILMSAIPVILFIYGVQSSYRSSQVIARDEHTSTVNLQPTISAARGHKIAQNNGCFSCHSVDGSEGAGPTFKNLYGHKVQLKGDSTVVADSAYIEESLKQPTAEIVKGFAPMMPKFSYLNDAKIKLLIVYLKSISD